MGVNMRSHRFLHYLRKQKSRTKPAQIAAVGKAEKTTSNVHDIADAHYLSVFLPFYEISYVPICMTEQQTLILPSKKLSH